MSKKKVIIISLLISLPIVASLATWFTTHQIMSVQKDKEKYSLAMRAFELHYADRIALFKEENNHLSNVDVSFIGDSLTEGYDVKTYYPQYNVVNRGISGDTTFGVEKRLDCSAYDVHAKVVTLLIGANNFGTMLNNYKNILDGFKTNIPESKIVLLSLTSMTKNWGRNNKKAQENNKQIEAYAKEYNYTYVDLYNPLLDPSTNELKLSYTTDGGHFTPEGYEKVTSVITPVLESLLI